jgi:hypothetical protein
MSFKASLVSYLSYRIIQEGMDFVAELENVFVFRKVYVWPKARPTGYWVPSAQAKSGPSFRDVE